MDLTTVTDRFSNVFKLGVGLGLWLSLSASVICAEELADVQAAVSSGSQLEEERSWKEAVDFYKRALKQFPETDSLSRGLRRSQFQFSIARRYSDDTFLRTLKPMSKDAAMALYDDVLTNVQNYYVDPINTTSLVAHGTESLWLALGNPRFLEENLFGASQERLQRLRRDLYERFWNKNVNGVAGARQLVSEVCDLCRQSVGLEAGPIVMEYVFGACNCLDDYSNVLSPGKKQDLFGNIKGEFVGIGIVMEADTGKGMSLSQVLPESPAAEAGLRRGDHITAVDGKDCRMMSTEEAAGLLAGRSGSRVALEVSRKDTSTFNVNCTRREVKVKSIPVYKMIDAAQGIAYIQMTGFQQSTVAEMDQALNDLNRQGMRSLIWDLRENPGGLLTAAIEVLDRFLEEGVIVSTRGRAGDQNMTYTAHKPGTWNTRIVLLIDENSASASEIVAGAIHDHKRGVIVGRTSFGKWSVQSIFDARYSTAIRLTTAKFYSPNGHTWGKIGLQPDVVVQNGPETRLLGEVDVENDPDLREALRQLENREFTKR
ncbi:S41 family peptidase [Planctomicrobium piriforme]|uniref:Carboxyl-terminal processing protease n=1 Tax=Planctomicrobium piriforme TaxID=1576369 RepID=A0A1I3M179_9PLAN|nr:S41 family peptidase [Planctomicrobium piriforme]SFI90733.1 carboxyl-terminal processing protease [Planctomicrobium piriforme]